MNIISTAIADVEVIYIGWAFATGLLVSGLFVVSAWALGRIE